MTEKDMLEYLKGILTDLNGKKAEIIITCENGDYEEFTVVKSLKKKPNKGYYNSKNRSKKGR